jgi:hypothetical protein
MRPLDLAHQYMEIFYQSHNYDELSQLLSSDFTFSGPFYKFDSGVDYINSLKSDPPEEFEYKIIRSFETESSVCLVYQFSKPGVCEPMAQMFEISDGKICKIILIFDTKAFT